MDLTLRLLLLPPDALRPDAPLPSFTGRPGSPAAELPMTHRQHTGEASSTVGVRAQLPFFASPAMENGLASKVFWRAAFFSFDQPVTLRYPITAKAAVTGHVPKVLLSSARQAKHSAFCQCRYLLNCFSFDLCTQVYVIHHLEGEIFFSIKDTHF